MLPRRLARISVLSGETGLRNEALDLIEQLRVSVDFFFGQVDRRHGANFGGVGFKQPRRKVLNPASLFMLRSPHCVSHQGRERRRGPWTIRIDGAFAHHARMAHP